MEHQVVLSDVDNDNVGADIDNDANDYDACDEDNENFGENIEIFKENAKNILI